MKNLNRVWLWALLAIAWMGFIYWLSDRPAEDLDGASEAVSWLPLASILVHVALYSVLSVFVLRALVVFGSLSEGIMAYLTVFIVLVYGILDEIHQSSVEGRVSEGGDVAADVFGAVVVVVFWFLFRRYRAGLGR